MCHNLRNTFHLPEADWLILSVNQGIIQKKFSKMTSGKHCIYLTEIRLSQIYESDDKIKHKLCMPWQFRNIKIKIGRVGETVFWHFLTKRKLAATICRIPQVQYSVNTSFVIVWSQRILYNWKIKQQDYNLVLYNLSVKIIIKIVLKQNF